MTRKTFHILSVVTTHLKHDDFGICSDIRVRDLFPLIDSDFKLKGVWLFYRSSVNEVFYFTGVPCDLVYTVARNPDKFVYLYRLD